MDVTTPARRPGPPRRRRRGMSLVEHAQVGADLARIRAELWAHYTVLLKRYGASPLAMRQLDRVVMTLDKVRIGLENLSEEDARRRWTAEERACVGSPYGLVPLYWPSEWPEDALGPAAARQA